jgi:hypothetical protein
MADRYWVGGTGTWNTSSTANWSATSGGSSGASVPTAADSVFFNAASASGNYTVTLTGALNCLDLNIAQAAAGTFATTSTGTISIAGSVISNGTGVTWGGTGTWTFTATSAKTITTGGLALPTPIIFNGAGGTWQLQDNFTASAVTTATTTLTTGTLDLNAKTFTTSAFISNASGVRGLVATGATINVVGNATSPWTTSTITNFTVTGRLTVNATYSGATGTRTMSFGALAEAVAPNVNLTAGTDIVQITGSVNNLNTTGFSGQFNGGLRTIYGSLTFGSGTTLQSSASTTTFAGTSGTKIITTNGKTISFPMTFNGAGSTFQLAGSYTGGATSLDVVTLTAGTLDLNGQAFSAFRFISTGTATRQLIATGSTFTLFGNGATILDVTPITGLTVTGLTTVTFTYAGAVGNRTITLNTAFTEAQAFNIVISGGSDTVILTGAMRNLDFTGFSGNLNAGGRTLYGNLTLGSAMTVVSGAAVTEFSNTSGTVTINPNGRAFAQAITFSGAGGTRQLLGNLDLSGRNFTLNAGTLDLNDFALTAFVMTSSTTTVKQIQFDTTGVINLSGTAISVWGFATATGFSYTGNARVNLTGNTSLTTRAISHGSTAGGTFATKAPPIYVTAGTDTISTTDGSHFSDLVFTATPTLSATGRIMYGNLILAPTQVLNGGASGTTFSGPGTQTFDTAQSLCNFPITIGNGVSNGTVALANALNMGTTRTLTLTSGNLVANGFNITAGVFSSTNSNPRILDISNVSVSLASTGVVWNMPTSANATVVATNSNILLTNTTTTARAFAGGGLTYGNLDIGGATGTSTLLITGNNTFAGALTSSKTVAHTVQFAVGTTTTVGAFTVSGSAGNVVTITSSAAAQHNLVLTGGGNVTTVNYLNISYSNASPDTDTWYPGINSINSGNNDGWMFPVSGGSSNFFLMF